MAQMHTERSVTLSGMVYLPGPMNGAFVQVNDAITSAWSAGTIDCVV